MAGGSADVDGWTINIPCEEVAVRTIIDAARSREKGFTVFTLNLDHLVKLRREPEFRRAYKAARYVTADGAPVVRLGRRKWQGLKRTTGADMLVPVCLAAAEQGLSIFLFGTTDEVLKGTIERLKGATNGKLRIAGYASPPRNFDIYGDSANEYIARIIESECALCFVLLGAPKQEIFATRAVEQGAKSGFICVGAAADFISGKASRAPVMVQKAGLEWLWRLASDPTRLAARYTNCAILLAELEWKRLFKNTA